MMAFIILLIISCVRAEVFLQQISPSYHPVCPGDDVTITCNVSTGSTALRWEDLLDPSAIDVIFTQNTDIGSTGVVGIFIAELINKKIPNFELSSEASVQNIHLNNNESSLSCSDYTIGSGNTKTILILISGVPSRPNNVSFTADTTTHLTLYWSPPTENINCIDKYIVKINDQQMETPDTSLSVPNLSIGSVYNVTVYSQDGANRNGNISEILMVTWKVPLPVSALSWNISEIDGNTIIILIWEHEEDTSRPSTQNFLISHNISEPWNNTTMNSSIILTGIKRGNTYVINVSAVNILGKSLPKEINVHIDDETMITTHTGITSVLSSYNALSSTFQVLNSSILSITTYEHTGIKSTSSIASGIKSMSTSITSATTTVDIASLMKFTISTSSVQPSNTVCDPSQYSISTAIAVAVPITAVVVVISSLITGIITFLITFIVTKKRYTKHSTVSGNIQLQSPGEGGPVYDTPQWNINKDNELHVETNKAYGQIK